MVTERELEWVDFWANWVSRCQLLAMEWNPQAKLLSVTTRKWKLVANACHLVWQTYAVYFSGIRLYTALYTQHVGLIFKVIYAVLAVSDVAMYLIHLSFAFSRIDLASLLNQLL